MARKSGRQARSLRPAGADDLGLRRALSDRLLPLLVAAMTFLGALALAGAVAAAALAERWRGGPASLLMVDVPQPDQPAPGGGARGDAVGKALHDLPGIASYHLLSHEEITALLRPWLGDNAHQLPAKGPAMFEVRRAAGFTGEGAMAQRVAAAAPGAEVERNGVWLDRLSALLASLQACAALALLVTAFIGSAVVTVATRAGLAARRDAIEIVHGLGATDTAIAGQFARRVTWLVSAGAALGVVLAIPVLLQLATLAAPFRAAGPAPASLQAIAGADLASALPALLWGGLAALPAIAALIGWLTAHATVRAWLARLP